MTTDQRHVVAFLKSTFGECALSQFLPTHPLCAELGIDPREDLIVQVPRYRFVVHPNGGYSWLSA